MDMGEVARRLSAVLELEVLEVDVDGVHRAADIEEREIIREFRFLDSIRAREVSQAQEESGEEIDSQPAESVNIDLVHWEAEQANQQIISEYHRTSDSEMTRNSLSVNTVNELDIDQIHAEADADLVRIQDRFWSLSQALQTDYMVQRARLDHSIDRWEQLVNTISECETNEATGEADARDYSLCNPP